MKTAQVPSAGVGALHLEVPPAVAPPPPGPLPPPALPAIPSLPPIPNIDPEDIPLQSMEGAGSEVYGGDLMNNI